MKFTVVKPVEIDVERVILSLPVRYGDEQMPFDFPGRDGDNWTCVVMIGSGQILDWPEGVEAKVHLKVVDEGSYALYSPEMECLAQLSNEYVPELIPGSYGDYVELDISGDGVITNWPENPDITAFFEID